MPTTTEYSKNAFVLFAWCGSNMFLYKYAIINNNIGIIKSWKEVQHNGMHYASYTKICLSCIKKISRKTILYWLINTFFTIKNPAGP